MSGGMGILSASASAAVIADALLKRSAGFLAMLRRITADKRGEILGLIRTGEIGIELMCCIITEERFSPRNGCTPVHIS
jgi:hypothetical protein